MHRIELTTAKKYRGTSEWRNIQVASCGDLSEAGDVPVIKALCKSMIDEGFDGDELAQVWRSGTKCFDAAKLSDWARGNPSARERPAQLKSGGRKSQN